MMNILFVTHRKTQCGVFEFGKHIYNTIKVSNKYNFIWAECNSLEDVTSAIKKHNPGAIIYNYHPSVLPWVCDKLTKGLYRNNISGIKVPQIGIIHEVTQEIADTATNYRNYYITGGSEKKLNSLFDYYIAPDPTLLLQNPIVFKTGRLVPQYEGNVVPLARLTIGSFGFATPKKGFERLVQKVQNEFDDAVIRLNLPAADFGDKDATNAHRIADKCRSLIDKPGIELVVTHDYFNDEQVLDFLAGNHLNAFLYEDKFGRGLSSTVDNALAVNRSLAVSDSSMFRHVLKQAPFINAEVNSLKGILEKGTGKLQQIAAEWNQENLLWEYERILHSVFRRIGNPSRLRMGIKKTIVSKFRRTLTLPDKSFTWLRDTVSATKDDLSVVPGNKYHPVSLNNSPLNRILDDSARLLYKPAEDKLCEMVPLTMSKKIQRANVQQAFVFDTVYRYLQDYTRPKVLCVGSYEDTASMSLQRLGFEVEEVDPMINYYLQEYFTKPSTIKESYNIIFSTSVIEHDPDDESFIRCIEGLLAPGGVAVITCDYKDGWKQGDPKPDVDARFYTRKDLGERLISQIPSCELVDTPQWDCEQPDFIYLNKYTYTFGTFVVRKKMV
jgi:SAM-dependent methyltransferase